MSDVFGVVYGLYDPRDGALRYIGQTTVPLAKRLCLHTARKELSNRRHVTSWLKQLSGLGLLPRIEELAVAYSREVLDTLETNLISEARSRGDKLTNHTNGGRGMSGYILSKETRSKMSVSRTGVHRSDETKAKISAANKGLVRSEELKKQWSIAHRSERTIQQIEATQGLVVQVQPRVFPKYESNLAGSKHPLYRGDLSTELILADLQSGLSRKQVAEKYRVTPRFICRRLFQAERAGISTPRSNRGRVIPTELILQRLGEGLTRKQVAEELGISIPLVSLRLRQMAVENG